LRKKDHYQDVKGVVYSNENWAQNTAIGTLCTLDCNPEKEGRHKVNKKAVRETVFNVQGVPIEIVKKFKYLGRVVNNKDDDRPTVMENLRKARM
jgi:hypothetical protein